MLKMLVLEEGLLDETCLRGLSRLGEYFIGEGRVCGATCHNMLSEPRGYLLDNCMCIGEGIEMHNYLPRQRFLG